MSIKEKIFQYQSYYVPILTYGAEIRTWAKADGSSDEIFRENGKETQKVENKKRKRWREFKDKRLGRKINKSEKDGMSTS
jgi:hypothetical protein